jgi:hypothetical protein
MADLGRVLGGVRLVNGLVHASAPVRTSVGVWGDDVRHPIASVFAAGFFLRDAILGYGALTARSDEELRRWLVLTVVADVVDAVHIVRHRESLPARRRWLSLSIAPAAAALGVVAIAMLRARR